MTTTAGEAEFLRRLGVFVGARWEKVYLRKFKPFLEDASFVPTWNWSAAIFTEFWFLYRKMYLWFAVFFFLPSFVVQWLWGDAITLDAFMAPENSRLRLIVFGVQMSVRLAAGGMANWLLFRRGSTAIRVLDAQQIGEAESMNLLQRLGGTNRTITLLILAVFFFLAVLQLVAANAP